VTKRTWTVIVIAVVVIGGIYVWSSIAKSLKTQELLTTLSSDDQAKVLDAMQQLRQRGPAIGPRLVPLLSGANAEAAFRAAELIGSTDYGGANAELEQALQSKDPDTRACAALALGRLHATEATSAIDALLANNDEKLFVRIKAADALGVLGAKDAKVVTTMAGILADHPPVPPPAPEGDAAKKAAPAPATPPPPPDKTNKLRVAVARALGMIGSESAIEPMRNAADSGVEPDAEVRVAAAYGLGDLAHAVPPEKSQGVVDGLLTALEDKNGDVRIAAAHSLANVKPDAAGRSQVELALQKAVDDDHYWVRRAARRALDRMGIPVVSAEKLS